jgi:copper resistance protein B
VHYEFRREFAPYLGIIYEKKYGHTADFARENGDALEDVRFAGGIRVRY